MRAYERVVTAYSFPLKDVLARHEQSIILDPDTLAQQDQGCLLVSCSMVFCPNESQCTESKRGHTDRANVKVDSQDLLSFAIPLLQDRAFLLAQLSQPVEEEIVISHVAMQSAFRQSHKPYLPIGRKASEKDTLMSALWNGVQWWAALADHAHRNLVFAPLWSKIAPPDAPALDLSPPSRFVISLPSFFSTHGKDNEDVDNNDEEEDEEDVDDDHEKICVESMVSFLCQMLDIHGDAVIRLRRSCRTHHGKLWTVLRSISGSLTLLRFTPSEIHQRGVDLSIQCSDLADLSAVCICRRRSYVFHVSLVD